MSIHTRMQARSEREKDLLKYGRRQGREQERERIIKLLDTDFWHHRIFGNEKPTCVSDCETCNLIALIKGETK